MASMPPAEMSSRLRLGIALGEAGLQLSAPHLVVLLGDEHDRQPAVGDLGRRLDAAVLQARPPDRDVAAHRMVDELQRLAEAGALPWRQRRLERLALVVELLLALPDHAAGLDVLLDPLHRLLVRHAVEALDHLRAAGAEAEDEPAVADVVAAGGRHRHQRRGAGVDVDDAGADLDRSVLAAR